MNKLFRNSIPFTTACRVIIILNVAVICFHMLVLGKVVPYQAVWGGRLKTVNEMYIFECLSIIINVLLILVVFIKMGKLRSKRFSKASNAVLLTFVIVFALNTLGNLVAVNDLERYIATPVTFILAILCWRVAIEHKGASLTE